jgi:hypothetical protein
MAEDEYIRAVEDLEDKLSFHRLPYHIEMSPSYISSIGGLAMDHVRELATSGDER